MEVFIHLHVLFFLQKSLSTTITRFKRMNGRAEKEGLASGRMKVPVRQKEYRSQQKLKVSNKLRFIEALYLTSLMRNAILFL